MTYNIGLSDYSRRPRCLYIVNNIRNFYQVSLYGSAVVGIEQ